MSDALIAEPDLCEVAAHLEREGCARIADEALAWFEKLNKPQGYAMAAAAEEIAVRIRAQTDPVGQETIDFVAALSALREERDRLRAAILWALGEGDDFPDWPATVTITGNPKYWWRKELRQRAALGERSGERE